jgi:hypothetical protein
MRTKTATATLVGDHYIARITWAPGVTRLYAGIGGARWCEERQAFIVHQRHRAALLGAMEANDCLSDQYDAIKDAAAAL